MKLAYACLSDRKLLFLVLQDCTLILCFFQSNLLFQLHAVTLPLYCYMLFLLQYNLRTVRQRLSLCNALCRKMKGEIVLKELKLKRWDTSTQSWLQYESHRADSNVLVLVSIHLAEQPSQTDRRGPVWLVQSSLASIRFWVEDDFSMRERLCWATETTAPNKTECLSP